MKYVKNEILKNELEKLIQKRMLKKYVKNDSPKTGPSRPLEDIVKPPLKAPTR